MTEPQTNAILTSYLDDVNRLYQDWQTAFQADSEVARYSTTGDSSENEEAKRATMVIWVERQKEDLFTNHLSKMANPSRST